ncbi:unnamed protein product [Meganyctiphanes norvegica]|uniref:Chitin-binding type-4 domain-containing protein n=1 Tax=Meganyctiphanes norvegica TaxID=48144 RepID=A0AAV2RQR9_MEGNR
MEEPPARNVMWRMGFNDLVPHPNDDYLVCAESGGADCPPCGDSLDGPKPYPHQAGGYFAPGIIVRTYTPGEKIDVFANVTISHGGFLDFKVCPNNDMGKPVTQRCLDRW